jgi:hypothetical protein
MTSQKALSLVLSSGALILTLQGVSSAQICTTDAGCARGTSCQPTGAGSGTGQGTSGSTGAVDAIPPICPDSQPNCAARAYDAGAAGTKTPTVPEMSCQPLSCKVDADCAATMVCHAESFTTCSGSGVAPACPPNQVCPPVPAPQPVTCTTTSYSACAFKWQLPCNVDADCGNAFTCAPAVSGTCGSAASGAGTGTSTGGVSVGQDGGGVAGGGSTSAGGKPTAAPNTPAIAVAPSPDDGGAGTAPPICTTTSSFPGYCQPKATTCTSDSDCPASWTCIATPDVTPTSTEAPPTGGSALGVASEPARDLAKPLAAKVCQPPAGFGVKGGVSTAPGGPTTGTSIPRGDSSGSAGALAPESDNGAPRSSGCSVARQADFGGSLLALGVLGLLLGVRANRRRRMRCPVRRSLSDSRDD